MATRTRRVNGELWVKEHGQPWRPASAQEQVSEETGPVGAFGVGVAGGTTDLLQMLGQAFNDPVAQQGAGLAGRNPQAYPETGPQLAAREVSQFSPKAVFAGQMAPDLATLPLGMTPAARTAANLTRSAFGPVSRRMPQRVAERIRSAAGPAAEPPGPSVAANVDEYGLPVSTVGAAEQTGPRTLRERVVDEFTAAQPLTDQQQAAARAIQSGQVRFQTLPGQIQGSRLMLNVTESSPIVRAEFEPELIANYREGSRLIKQGLGIPEGTPMSDDMLDVAETTIGAKFNAARDMVTQPITLSEEALQVAEPALSPWQRRAIALREGEGEARAARPLPAEEIFELRSRLNNLARELGRKGEVNALDDVIRTIEEIDDKIAEQIGEGGQALWEEARNQWRVKLMVESTNAINKAGGINVQTMANAAQKVFRKQYRGWGPRKGLPDATQQLLDWVKTASAFPSAVGNSGTPERLVSMQALTSPKEYLKHRAVGRMIRWAADQTLPSEPAGLTQ